MRPVVLKEGDLVAADDAGTSRVSKGGASVACSCPNVELACRILNYFYSADDVDGIGVVPTDLVPKTFAELQAFATA